MSLDTAPETPEQEKIIALALMQTIMTTSVAGADALSELYVQLKIGGGFFKGRPMPEEIAKKTRYELIAYISALTRILMENWQECTSDSNSILSLLEPAVFSGGLANARPAYDRYVGRYHDNRPGDSTALPREGVVHSKFIQKLSVDIWCYWAGLNTPESRQYSHAIFEITRKIENGLRSALNEIWPGVHSSSG